MTQFYPDQTVILPQTTIRRERLLPPDVVGEVLVREGERVSAVDLVARGVRSSRYVILDLKRMLGVSADEDLEQLLQVAMHEPVTEGQVIAGEPDGNKRKRGPVVKSPVKGRVLRLVEGRLVLQTGLSEIVVRAGYNGTVASVRGHRGILLETAGALVQGVWGNGASHFGVLRIEPSQGLESLEVDEFSTEWRGAIVVTTQTLTEKVLRHIEKQGLGGIIGPSMHTELIPVALDLKIPIMLTEGFGRDAMSSLVHSVLEPLAGRQAAINAYRLERGAADRPEVIVPLRADATVQPPARDEPLRIGAEVRMTRQPYLGLVGKVKNLPDMPRVIDNGLRLPVAEVVLPSGRTVTVPLVNLELFGRG
jgi:hypothetical protein